MPDKTTRDIKWEQWDEESQQIIKDTQGSIAYKYYVSHNARTGKYQLIKMDVPKTPIGLTLGSNGYSYWIQKPVAND